MAHSEFLDTIKARGFVHQMTDEDGLRALLAAGPQTAYIGFDCTAPSLHVGSLLQIMLLRWWQKTGNRPIVLLGGGTTKIGDPSGKDESRPPLTDEAINANMEGIKTAFVKLGLGDATFVNNDEWLQGLEYISFLRDHGRHFSVNNMLTMDSVRLRLERQQHLSFLEFNYMILQAFDFVELGKRYDCRVQMGGSDQWGNIIQGIDLHRRLKRATLIEEYKKTGSPELASNIVPIAMGHNEAELDEDLEKKYNPLQYEDNVFGITSPLITTASGAKMGKTAAGAVWLNADLTSPYDYWQYWRNTEDADVARFLKLFTELPLEEIDRLAALGGAEINEAKKLLATEATALLHGADAAREAAETARRTFEEGGAGEALPETIIDRAEAEKGIPAYDLFFRARLAASNGEARRLIRGGGARINGTTVETETHPVTPADFANGPLKLSAGKKRHALVRLAG